MTDFEMISFCQCCSVLNKHVVYVATFSGLDLSVFISILKRKCVNYRVIRFKRDYFLSIKEYNNLLFSFFFYSRFLLYKYILIYQLDCFVFRDDLDKWASLNHSYIGAPWLHGYDSAAYGNQIAGVGNGGLSLRCVADHLRVLLSFKRIREKRKIEKNNNTLKEQILFFVKEYFSGNTFFLFNDFEGNEDIFWSNIAGKQFSWFKIPDWRIAAQFSIEVQPKYFFELNNHILPFGCHAWWRYDLSFWKPHIEKFGYQLPEIINEVSIKV